jgi:hypothetical protein
MPAPRFRQCIESVQQRHIEVRTDGTCMFLNLSLYTDTPLPWFFFFKVPFGCLAIQPPDGFVYAGK